MLIHDLWSCIEKAKNIYYFIIFAFFLPFLLGGCKMKSDDLKTLESSISIIQLTTGREISRFVEDKSSGFTGPIYAKIRIEYEPTSHYTKEDVYEEIIAILMKNNWERDEWNFEKSDYFSASMQQNNFPLTVIVRVYSEENLVNIRMTNMNP